MDEVDEVDETPQIPGPQSNVRRASLAAFATQRGPKTTASGPDDPPESPVVDLNVGPDDDDLQVVNELWSALLTKIKNKLLLAAAKFWQDTSLFLELNEECNSQAICDRAGELLEAFNDTNLYQPAIFAGNMTKFIDTNRDTDISSEELEELDKYADYGETMMKIGILYEPMTLQSVTDAAR